MYTAHGKNEDKDQLLSQHAGLVKKIGCQLKAKLPASVELDDLIQAGMMGLIAAATSSSITRISAKTAMTISSTAIRKAAAKTRYRPCFPTVSASP